MPRWASRINLAVKDVRVERVQDISADDAKAEGVSVDDDSPEYCPECHGFLTVGRPDFPHDCGTCITHKGRFTALWDSINGRPRKDGTDISWAANPWVFVVEFEKIANG